MGGSPQPATGQQAFPSSGRGLLPLAVRSSVWESQQANSGGHIITLVSSSRIVAKFDLDHMKSKKILKCELMIPGKPIMDLVQLPMTVAIGV